MLKRINVEKTRQVHKWNFEASENSSVAIYSTDCTEATIVCPPTYPFNPPSITWEAGLIPPITFRDVWHWFVVVLRRPSNQRFAVDASTCLCCQSPTCEWNVTKRVDDVIAYAMCLRDASFDPGPAPGWFARLPIDIALSIIALTAPGSD